MGSVFFKTQSHLLNFGIISKIITILEFSLLYISSTEELDLDRALTEKSLIKGLDGL